MIIEYKAFDGIVKGHPDFEFCGYPGDFKSIALDDWMPSSIYKMSKKVSYQMQAYMRYSNQRKSLVIYESRQSGKLISFWISENKRIQNIIHERFSRVVNVVNEVQK